MLYSKEWRIIGALLMHNAVCTLLRQLAANSRPWHFAYACPCTFQHHFGALELGQKVKRGRYRCRRMPWSMVCLAGGWSCMCGVGGYCRIIIGSLMNKFFLPLFSLAPNKYHQRRYVVLRANAFLPFLTLSQTPRPTLSLENWDCLLPADIIMLVGYFKVMSLYVMTLIFTGVKKTRESDKSSCTTAHFNYQQALNLVMPISQRGKSLGTKNPSGNGISTCLRGSLC